MVNPKVPQELAAVGVDAPGVRMGEQPPPACAACGSRKPFRRGLCRRCYDDADTRSRHAPHFRRGAASPRYRGGEYQDVTGRLWARCPGHPKADQRGFVLRKYLIFEKFLGRQLRKDEVITQMDDDNGNVALENLRIRFRRSRGDFKLTHFETIEDNLERHGKALAERIRWENLPPEAREKEIEAIESLVHALLGGGHE